MPEGYKTCAFLGGSLRNIRIKSQVDEVTLKRLTELTSRPSGGIHVIHHVPTDPDGKHDYFAEFKARNPGFHTYVGYTTFETDRIPDPWVSSCNQMDEIWVPSTFNLKTFARSGVQREKLHVVPHGLDPRLYRPEVTSPLDVGIQKDFTFLSIFEWTYRKGWDVLLKAYLEEFSPEEDVRLVIRSYQGGGVIGKNVPPVSEQLSGFIQNNGFDPDNIPTIIFLANMVPSSLMPSLYKTADIFVLPTRGEGWGIPFTESMLMQVPVIATRWGGHLEFMNDENSYLIDIDGIVPVSTKQVTDSPFYRGHRWAEPSVKHLKLLMRHAFENRGELEEKGQAARQHILDNFTIHHAALKVTERLLEIEKKRATRARKLRKTCKLKILFQARSDVFTVPGGDTEVLDNIRKALEQDGIQVDFSCNPAVNLTDYDIVHIFNSDTSFAINSLLQEKPYLLTPMYEDFGSYYPASVKVVKVFRDYLKTGKEKLVEKELSRFLRSYKQLYTFPELSFVMSGAMTVCVSGLNEKNRLKKDFPGARNIQIVKLGFNRAEDQFAVNEDLFVSKYGVSDFVLCVGRLETRKNQLMLLYALKDEDLPVVFVNSKTNQPEYELLCKRFNRKGRTIFTGRISKEMLYSAYKAARVHALPSWYELPGLVSLEAAWWGCNVVASSWGTIKDYLKTYAYYCEPQDPASVKNAVLSAMSNPYDQKVRRLLKNYTWPNQAQRILAIYEKVLAGVNRKQEKQWLKRKSELAKKEVSFFQLQKRANDLATKNPGESIRLIECLLDSKPTYPVCHFIKGLAYLNVPDLEKAEESFKKTIELRPWFDVMVYLYLALSLMRQKKYFEAIDVLEESLSIHPFAPVKTRSLIDEYMEECEQMMASSASMVA